MISLAADAGLGRLLVSACDANGVCTVRGYKNGSFKVISTAGLSGLRINQVLVRGDDYFAATTNGIYIRDNTGSQWIQKGAAGKNMLATYATQNACLMAAGGGGVTYTSSNCGTVWQLTTSELNRWSFQAALIDLVNSSRFILVPKKPARSSGNTSSSKNNFFNNS